MRSSSSTGGCCRLVSALHCSIHLKGEAKKAHTHTKKRSDQFHSQASGGKRQADGSAGGSARKRTTGNGHFGNTMMPCPRLGPFFLSPLSLAMVLWRSFGPCARTHTHTYATSSRRGCRYITLLCNDVNFFLSLSETQPHTMHLSLSPLPPKNGSFLAATSPSTGFTVIH
jgi:hypothetical protein